MGSLDEWVHDVYRRRRAHAVLTYEVVDNSIR